MARFFLSCHATVGVAKRSDGDSPSAGIPIYGPPEDDPDLYEVVAAAKLALPPGTAYVRLRAITGSVYVSSGTSGSDDIVAPHGVLVEENGDMAIAIARAGGVLHTHLLVIAGDPTTDPAVDLNA